MIEFILKIKLCASLMLLWTFFCLKLTRIVYSCLTTGLYLKMWINIATQVRAAMLCVYWHTLSTYVLKYGIDTGRESWALRLHLPCAWTIISTDIHPANNYTYLLRRKTTSRKVEDVFERMKHLSIVIGPYPTTYLATTFAIALDRRYIALCYNYNYWICYNFTS